MKHQTAVLVTTAFLVSTLYWNAIETQWSAGPLHPPPKPYYETTPDGATPEDFRDVTFAPLLQAYRDVGQKPLRTSFRAGKIPKFLLWSQPHDQNFWKAQLADIQKGVCPLPCSFTFDSKQVKSVDAVVVYLRGVRGGQPLRTALGKRDPWQPWVVLSFEAPPRANTALKTNLSSLNGVFNRTMLYRRDADVVVPHGFVVSKERDADVLPVQWHASPLDVPAAGGGKNVSRRMAAAFVSNCRDDSGRLRYIKELKKFLPVDLYGRCGNLTCGHSMYVEHRYDPRKDKCLRMAGGKYLFYFAFENSLCRDYVTEKLYNVLYYPTVPVVYGAADYASLLPPNSYINAREYKPFQLAQLLRRLSNDSEEYHKYHEWRQHYRVSTWGGQRSLCHLCTRLHDPDFYQEKVVHDFQKWFVRESHCNKSAGKP